MSSSPSRKPQSTLANATLLIVGRGGGHLSRFDSVPPRSRWLECCPRACFSWPSACASCSPPEPIVRVSLPPGRESYDTLASGLLTSGATCRVSNKTHTPACRRAHHAMTAVHGGRAMLLGICPASPRSAPGPAAAYLLRRSRSERLGVSFVVGTGRS
jgi:hypothetical protein